MLTLGLATAMSAQFGGGARFGYANFVTESISSFGVGANIDVQSQDASGWRIGFHFGLPVDVESTYVGEAKDPSIDQPETLEITGISTISTFTLFADYRKYLNDSNYEIGGLYAVGGAGVTIASEKIDVLPFSSNYDQTTVVDGADQNFTQFMVRAFIGYEFNLEIFKLYGEIGGALPATESDNRAGSTAVLPGFVEVAIGIRL